jgi:hypothetical protein
MAKLFDIQAGKITINEESLAIPPFKALWDRDKTKTKERATKEISFVAFLCDYKSPYFEAYTEDQRLKVLKRDFLGDENFELDEVLENAIERYKEFRETTNTRLLRTAKATAEKLAEWFYKIDFDARDRDGRPIYTARDVSANLKDIGGIVKSLDVLERQVQKEQLEQSRARGGSDIGDYEIPDDDDR